MPVDHYPSQLALGARGGEACPRSGEVAPALFGERHRDLIGVRGVEQMATDVEPKPLDLGSEVVLGQGVDRVLHGVGGKDLVVVTVDVGLAVVAGEQHTHRQIGDLVASSRLGAA